MLTRIAYDAIILFLVLFLTFCLNKIKPQASLFIVFLLLQINYIQLN